MTKKASLLRNRWGKDGRWWRGIYRGRRVTKGEERGEKGKGARYRYEETGAMPVVVIDEEKEKALKVGYMTLYAKLFGGKHQK